MKKDIADIVIIGAGAAGSAGAWNLSENSNFKIICLEQGPELEQSKFPKSKAEQISTSDFDIDPNNADAASLPMIDAALSKAVNQEVIDCLLYTSPSPRDS